MTLLAQFSPFPEQASDMAARVDDLTIFLVTVTGTVGFLVTVCVIGFALHYRRRDDPKTPRIYGSWRLETLWSVIPLVFFLAFFVWGARIYVDQAQPPEDAYTVYGVGKQWMWKFQHPGGQREINELHLPVNRPVQLLLTSEDVIHDVYVPAFRMKTDVLPRRFVQTWYHPTRVGRYHLFCAEYCGTNHSQMRGWVVVQEPGEYEAWLNSHAEGSLALQGRKHFLRLQCVGCHSADAEARAPVLENLYGRTVPLADGTFTVADENYLRESILRPQAKVVAGWQPIMPSYDGLLPDKSENLGQEEVLIQLLAYLKALGSGQTPPRNEEMAPPVQATAPQAGQKKDGKP
jgi:cytochrome c oxidase subunit 2